MDPLPDTSIVAAELRKNRGHIDRLAAPASPGVYAMFLVPGATLPVDGIPDDGLIYVGTSSNLAERDAETHFKTGQSGFSTLRRSLGAILKEELGLVAIPRGTGASPTNFRNYKFTPDGEKVLTDWMRSNVEVAAFPARDAVTLEDALIPDLEPILCLRKWKNPAARDIEAMRKACVEEAKLTPH